MMERKGFGRPKTKEELQAQIEYFGETKLVPHLTKQDNQEMKEEKTLQSLKEQHDLLQQSSELAKIKGLNDVAENKYKDEYINSIKENSTKNKAFQAECIRRYEEEFSPAVQTILDQINSNIDVENIEGYMQSGNNAHIFTIQTSTGEYILKVYKEKKSMVPMNTSDLESMRRGINVKNASHLVAYSHKDKVQIMKKVEGKNFLELTLAERPNLNDKELHSLISTLIDLNSLEIMPDMNPKNLMFDEKEGITVIDYQMNKDSKKFVFILQDIIYYISTRKDCNSGDDYYQMVDDLNYRIPRVVEKDFPVIYNQYKTQFDKWKGN